MLDHNAVSMLEGWVAELLRSGFWYESVQGFGGMQDLREPSHEILLGRRPSLPSTGKASRFSQLAKGKAQVQLQCLIAGPRF